MPGLVSYRQHGGEEDCNDPCEHGPDDWHWRDRDQAASGGDDPAERAGAVAAEPSTTCTAVARTNGAANADATDASERAQSRRTDNRCAAALDGAYPATGPCFAASVACWERSRPRARRTASAQACRPSRPAIPAAVARSVSRLPRMCRV